MIPRWQQFPSWEIQQVDGIYLVKVNDTSVKTYVGDQYKDPNVRIDLHYTDKDRLVGYTVHPRKRADSPRLLLKSFYGGIFYSTPKLPMKQTRKNAQMVYHDYNVRLIAFGDSVRSRDYLFVVRYKPQQEEMEA